MRYPAEWMQKSDDRILEILHEDGPRGVGYIYEHPAIHVARSTVSRRLHELSEHSLVSPRGNGVYMITEKGQSYLNEEYDVERDKYLTESDEGSSVSAGERQTG